VARNRLSLSVKVPQQYRRADFVDAFNLIDAKVNALGEGAISGFHNATTAIPSGFPVGTYAVGDFVRNTNLTQIATSTLFGGATYCIEGWICIDQTTNVGAFKPKLAVITG